MGDSLYENWTKVKPEHGTSIMFAPIRLKPRTPAFSHGRTRIYKFFHSLEKETASSFCYLFRSPSPKVLAVRVSPSRLSSLSRLRPRSLPRVSRTQDFRLSPAVRSLCRPIRCLLSTCPTSSFTGAIAALVLTNYYNTTKVSKATHSTGRYLSLSQRPRTIAKSTSHLHIM